MKTLKSCAAVLLAALALSVSAEAAGQYGAAAAEEGVKYTTEQTLNLAIQQEYLAGAKYAAYAKKFKDEKLFAAAADAAKAHVGLLASFFEKQGLEVPADDSKSHLDLRDTLPKALKDGADTSRAGMRMYGLFLKQELPDGVKAAFTVLKIASGQQARAFGAAAKSGGGRPGKRGGNASEPPRKKS